ncbi:MAG: DUF6785 family protein [Candidatus Bathyarchaeia archaeon]
MGLVIFAAVLSFISMNAVMFASYFSHYFNFGNNWWGIAPGPFFVLIVLLGLRFIPPVKRIEPRQVHVLLSTSMMVSLTSSFRYPLSAIFQLMPIRFTEPWMSRLGSYVPTFWVPAANVLEPAMTGGAPVPWGDWAPVIAFWVLWGWGAYFLGASVAMIMRRRFVEVERMTFPVAQAYQQLVAFWQKGEAVEVSSGEKPRYSRTKMTLVGLIIGIITVLPWILRLSFAWFPSLYGWEALPWAGHAGLLLLEYAIPALHYALPMATLEMSLNPIVVGMGLLLSLDVLFSSWVSWLIFGVLVPVSLANAGYYPSPGPWGQGARYWIYGHTGVYEAVAFFDIGLVFFGLSIWPLIFGWRYIREVAGSIMRPKPGEAEREGFTYRTMFIIFIFGLALIGALALVSGTGVPSVLALWLFATLAVLAMTRIHGEAVTFMDSFQHFHSGNLYNTVFPGWTDDMVNQNYYNTMVLGHSLFGRDFVNNPGGTTAYAFNNYRLQLYSKTWVRDLFIAATIGVMVGLPVALITQVHLGYSAGVQKTPGGNTAYWWIWWIIPAQMPTGAVTRPTAPYLDRAIIGFLAAGALMFLRARFAWFPLNAVGVGIGATTAQAFQGFGAAYLVSWIIKYALLKLGGARAYDGYVIPFIGGFIGGWMTGLLIGTILSVLKFFFPW